MVADWVLNTHVSEGATLPFVAVDGNLIRRVFFFFRKEKWDVIIIVGQAF